MDFQHMEELWDQAESLSPDSNIDSILNEVSIIVEKLKGKPEEVTVEFYGHLLFLMCSISKKLSINSYVALKQSIEDAQETLLDP